MLLSYIVFLHQTTTTCKVTQKYMHCLISSFYIKPQQSRCLGSELEHCLILSFYIKPQLTVNGIQRPMHCLILSFYIKPQPFTGTRRPERNCLILSFYIKPQLSVDAYFDRPIVLYCLSTSNHNIIKI